MIQQLRIYQIDPGLKDHFGTRFREHAMRIMKNYGFNIKAMWYSEHDNTTEFIYILEWDNTDVSEKAWERFMADEEWAEIKRKSKAEHGQMVVGIIRSQVLENVAWHNNTI